jgi:8-oxo-dGTP diphosphatase
MTKEGIGTEFTGITVLFFCHDGKGRYLISKRSKNTRDEQGTWDPGAGGLKFNERVVEDALVRELMEEYCTKPIEVNFLGFRDLHRVHDNKPTHWVALDFRVKVDPMTVKIGEPHKCDGLQWVTIKELDDFPEPLHSQFPYFLNKYKNQLQ